MFAGLSRRIYVAFLLIAVVPLAAAGAIGVFLSLQTLRAETMESLEREVQVRARAMEGLLQQLAADLLFLAAASPARLEKEGLAFLDLHPQVLGFHVLDRESRERLAVTRPGKAVAALSPTGEGEPAPGQVQVSPLKEGQGSAPPVLTMTAPLAQGGFLAMDVDAAILLDPVQAMADSRRGTAYLLDASGHYLAREAGGEPGAAAPRAVARLGEKYPAWAVAALAGGEASPRRGDGWVFAQGTLALPGSGTWKIALVFPEGELFRPIRALYLLYAVLMAALAATAVAGYGISRRLLRPLEERSALEAIVEHTADGILAVAPDGRLSLANPAARRLLASEAPAGRPLSDFWPQWPAIAADAAREPLRCDLELPGGILALTVTPTAAGHIVVARDVSRERESQGLRRELDRQMFQMEKMATLGELAMGIAHEIGNPLAGMKAVAQAMQYEEDIPPGLVEALQRLEGEVDRLAGFLKTFHGFAAPQPPLPEACDLEGTLKDVLFWLGKEARSRRVSFDLAGVAGLPPLWADPQQLKQLLLNLLVNGVNAMAAGGVLTVAARVENGRARIEVRDTGKGMAPAVLARIFEPFFTTRREGSGLGLAIVRKIADQHGGQIEAASTPGQGSTFVLLWPLAGKNHG